MPRLATAKSRGHTNLGAELELLIAWRRVPMFTSCKKADVPCRLEQVTR